LTPPKKALAFLEGERGLPGRLPGFVGERHAQLFAHRARRQRRWQADAATHVDIHADLSITT